MENKQNTKINGSIRFDYYFSYWMFTWFIVYYILITYRFSINPSYNKWILEYMNPIF